MAAYSSVLLASALSAAGCASLQSLPDPPTAPAVVPIVAPSAEAGPPSQLRRTGAPPALRLSPTRAATASLLPDDSEDDAYGGFFYRAFYPASRTREGRS